jgi:hypothetical protein
MRFLFVFRNAGGLRAFEAPIRALCDEGDEVVVMLAAEAPLAGPFKALEVELDGLTVRPGGASYREDADANLSASIRTWIDYLRYFEPELARATPYRERSGRPLPKPVRQQTDETAGESRELRRALAAGLRAIERSLPVPEGAAESIARERPDAVIISPLLKRGSPQTVYLRAARRLGIPSALLVWGWDDLVTRGLIHEVPDLVSVWNDAQREEATRLHGVPSERVVVAGAPRFDAWLGRMPSSSPQEYRRRLGLPADRPHLLYVCSPRFTAPDEGDWIAGWVSALRDSPRAELRDVPVVVRPHPGVPPQGGSKRARRLGEMANVVVDPPDGSREIDAAALAEYFDAIHHSAAVVGVNTTAMVDAAVVGRGVHVLLAKRYRETQEDSPHFGHLTSAGGLVVATGDGEEHYAGLARALRGEDAEEVAARTRAFVGSFVRPRGPERPVTPVLVEALRGLAARPAAATAPESGDLADALRAVLAEDSATAERAEAGRRPPD